MNNVFKKAIEHTYVHFCHYGQLACTYLELAINISFNLLIRFYRALSLSVETYYKIFNGGAHLAGISEGPYQSGRGLGVNLPIRKFLKRGTMRLVKRD